MFYKQEAAILGNVGEILTVHSINEVRCFTEAVKLARCFLLSHPMILKIDKEGSEKHHYSWYEWIAQFRSNSAVKCAFRDEQNGETVITHANEISHPVVFSVFRHRGSRTLFLPCFPPFHGGFPRCHVGG